MGRFSSTSVNWMDRNNSLVAIGDMNDQYIQTTLLWCASRLQTAQQFPHHPELTKHNFKELSEWIDLFDNELKERKSKAVKEKLAKVEKALEELKTREEKKEELIKQLEELKNQLPK